MANPTQPLLREVIDIPEELDQNQYVLKLVEALEDEETLAKHLDEYVITERLVEHFGEALTLIESALGSGISKAAYLHGSFGSGKSHFMMVLSALLGALPEGARRVRDTDEFVPLVRQHSWMHEKKLLLLPYHMMDAKSIEQRVLGGYVDHIRRRHPGVGIPQVYRTDALFENVREHRSRMTDEAFIDGLPSAPPGVDDEWGDDDVFWDTEKLDIALDAVQVDEKTLNDTDEQWLHHPTTPGGLRAKLVSDVLSSWFKGFFTNATEDRHGFISLDRGLSVIAGHAKSLGYDGVVLFLDELILWMASRIVGEKEVVAQEVAKITNFVEGSDVRRPIPVISFIARQRDLRHLVGDKMVSGASEVTIQDALSLADDRFSLITLPDSDLPEIAYKRLLHPRTDVPDAEARIDQAFTNIQRVKPDIWNALLGSSTDITNADETAFRKAFPFSPAFMDTLVRVAEALSRSRSGLRLMGQMLSDNRETLPLGQLVPLGDLFEVLNRGGGDPFTQQLREQFRSALKLYRTTLRPYLLNTYEISDADVDAYLKNPDDIEKTAAEKIQAFIADNRLMGTLLLSALAPSVPAFQNLTIKRLAALNHGVITAPVPGFEAKAVSKKAKEWAEAFPEIRYGDGPDAGISLKLVDVDYESVVTRAESNNNGPNRRSLLKRLLWEELSINQGQLDDQLQLVWRGSRRSLEVVFGNIANPNSLADEKFSPRQDGNWRLVIDMPFDDLYGTAEDRERVERLRAASGSAARPRTICWIPAHFTSDLYAKFQRLVIVDYVLTGQRFESFATQLSPNDRERAKDALESQHRQLKQTIKDALKQAYGLAPKDSAKIRAYDEHVMPLPDMPPIVLQYNQSLYDAVRLIADNALAHQFPAHPDFDPQSDGLSVKTTDVKTVFDYLRDAADEGLEIIDIAPKHRSLMARIAGQKGLKLGVMHEARFELGRHWVEHFNVKAGLKYEDKDIPVTDLLGWIDTPSPYGLDTPLANLVLCAYAERTDRVWTPYGGGTVEVADPMALKPGYRLRAQERPDEETWNEALDRAERILVVTVTTRLRRARLIAEFAQRVRTKAHADVGHAYNLVQELERRAGALGLDLDSDEGRLGTARRAHDLLRELDEAQGPLAVVRALASAEVGPAADQDRMGTSITTASNVGGGGGIGTQKLLATGGEKQG
ncbi:phage resistance protein, partial [Streptomyces sp. NPDC059142]|uniref:phage resistance protein n=1 Tax=Streptomyces sp. NPDC059142 TaxID=3346739 RepID=UPI00367C3789